MLDSGKNVRAKLKKFKDLRPVEVDAVDKEIPELKNILGGWIAPSSSSGYKMFMISDIDGKLRIDKGSIPGGGTYVVFDLNNISANEKEIKAEKGKGLNEGGNLYNCEFTAIPSDADDGEYIFDLKETDMFSDEEVTYSKVGDTERELLEWVNEHYSYSNK